MVNKPLSMIATAILALLSVGQNVLAQESFFKGKNIRIVVASTAGGGFDAYTRMLSRYLGKYIPGNPSIVVENMPGAGHLIGANHIYKVAKPDGLTIGHFQGGLFLHQLLGRPGIEFDARKFEFIGAPVTDNRASGKRHHKLGEMAGIQKPRKAWRHRRRGSRRHRPHACGDHVAADPTGGGLQRDRGDTVGRRGR